MPAHALGVTHRTAPQLELPRHPVALQETAHAGNRQYFMGTDYVEGFVRIRGVRSLAHVRLYDQEIGALIAQQWTDKLGNFRFERVAADRKCFAVAFDPVTGEKAEVFDRL